MIGQARTVDSQIVRKSRVRITHAALQAAFWQSAAGCRHRALKDFEAVTITLWALR